jgi:hypothetical protein
VTRLPAGYWDLRTEPVVVDGLMWPVTACSTCGKRFPPYKAAVPIEVADEYCWERLRVTRLRRTGRRRRDVNRAAG